MKLIIFSILLFFCFNVTFSQLENTYIVDLKGNKSLLYENIGKKLYVIDKTSHSSDYLITAQFFYYHDSQGKLTKVSQSDLDSLVVGDHIFITKGIKGNGGPKRLHEILINSSEYTVTQYFSGMRVLYIYDKNGNCVLSRNTVSRKLKDDQETMDKEIQPRFKDCPELLETIKKNLASKYYSSSGWGANNRDNMFDGIYNYTCK